MINRIDKVIFNIEKAVSVILLMVLVFDVLASILFRFTDVTFTTGVEIATYVLIWLGLLGASMATYKGTHFNVDFLVKMLGVGANKNILRINNIISCILGIILTISSVKLVRITWDQFTTMTDIRMGAILLIVPICFALIAFHSLVKIITPAVQENIIFQE
jgi:TRAP-type C4-dicarboxylate transport system permease small subunit